MKYALIVNGVVKQTRLSSSEGFEEVPANVSIGDVKANGGEFYTPEDTEQKKIDRYRRAVSAHIDTAAMSVEFDSVLTAVTYAGEPADPLNEVYGAAFREWRSLCWKKCRSDLEAWQSGGEEPSIPEVISGLPVFVDPTQNG